MPPQADTDAEQSRPSRRSMDPVSSAPRWRREELGTPSTERSGKNKMQYICSAKTGPHARITQESRYLSHVSGPHRPRLRAASRSYFESIDGHCAILTSLIGSL